MEIKVLAFINEFDDPAAAGDEFGVVIPLVVMTIVTFVILLRTRQQTSFPEAKSIPEMKKSEN